MFLILTMAGRYQRFLTEGFKTPKYLLPWGDKTILAELLFNLNKDKPFKDIFLVANHRDNSYFPHVRASMNTHKIQQNNLIITSDTSGQLETAQIGVEALENIHGEIDEPILIHNIDTILLNRNFKEIESLLNLNSGYIDIFSANNKEYSYVLVEQDNRVTEIAEKILVSDLATSGLYGFRNSKVFKKYANNNDIFISSIFRKMIEDDQFILASKKHKEDSTIVLGTPEEYLNASQISLVL
jgi:NDP-sugar pyrophosphorylase family protein